MEKEIIDYLNDYFGDILWNIATSKKCDTTSPKAVVDAIKNDIIGNFKPYLADEDIESFNEVFEKIKTSQDPKYFNFRANISTIVNDMRNFYIYTFKDLLE